jgi:LacI family transcriptional regulator, repressor for deo operon, udp, cdd, tsx, nupC, and nupG
VPGPDRKSVTSSDVARLAGVSQSTVSLVLGDKAAGRVSQAVQEKVREAARRLRYQPHPSARALRSGRTQAVGLFVPDVTNPFLGRVLRGAQRVARGAGYTVALVEPGDDRDFQLSAMRALRDRGIDGLLLFTVEPGLITEELSMPVVLIEGEHGGAPSVKLDIAGGTAAGIEHLQELGHQRIGHLGVDLPLRTFGERASGWRSALEKAGVAAIPSLEILCDFRLDSAREKARQLLSEAQPTALFCDDDLLAAGARLAAGDLGLDVPADLSLVGFAGTILSEVTTPPLTTVVAPAEELGATAMEKMLAVLDDKPVDPMTVLPVALEPRGSTAAAPR